MKVKIESMHCMGCFRNIQDAVQELDQNASCTPDIASRTLSVSTTKSLDEIKVKLADEGYPVTEVLES